MSQLTADELTSRAARIRLLLLDVDGVLTDGSIIYADDGTELKRFHVRDGSGLKLWRLAGNRAAVLSGRTSPAGDGPPAGGWVAPPPPGGGGKTPGVSGGPTGGGGRPGRGGGLRGGRSGFSVAAGGGV